MQLIFTDHAVDRMTERNISTADVKLVLTNADGEIQQSMDKRIVYKKISGRSDNLIAVVAVDRPLGVTEVVTVMVRFEVRT